MRILHLFDHSLPLQSGYTFRSRNIIAEQRKLGWETHHLTSPKHARDGDAEFGDGFEDVDGLRFYRTAKPSGVLASLPGIGEYLGIRAARARLAALADELEPDVIHAHSPVLNALAALPVARARGIPLIYEVRAFWEDAAAANGTTAEGSPRFHLTRMMEDYALKNADAVTTICQGLKEDMIRRGIEADKITLIPNAVSIDHFTETPPRDGALAAKLGLGDKKIVGFIGSFYPYEGIDTAITALPAIVASGIDAALLLVGGGPDAEKLKARAAELGLNDRVIFTGRVPHTEVPRYSSLVDVFVFPRKSLRLTDLVTPLKPLEAMAQKKLVAASDVGGHRELIKDGITGSLFRADNPEALADCIIELLGASDIWPERLDTARKYVEDERTWEKSVANYAPILERFLNDFPRQ